MGLPLAEVFQDGELLAESMLLAWREFGHDMILLENGTACNAQACGVEVIYREDAAPAAHNPVITCLDEVDNLEVPDPYTTFPMNEVLKATRILSKEIGDDVWICARADQGPMDLAAQLIGIQHLMLEIALGENPDGIHRLLDYARQVATRYAYALIECGGRSTSIGEPIAGPDLLHRNIIENIRSSMKNEWWKNSKPVALFCITTSVETPSPSSTILLPQARRCWRSIIKQTNRRPKDAGRGKTCFLGTIDTSLLLDGTPAEVEDACQEAIEIMAPDSGFILGPGCALDPEAPADNIHALDRVRQKIWHLSLGAIIQNVMPDF